MTTLLLTKLFLAASLKYNLPDGLLSSVCYIESGHNVNAIHLNDGIGNSVGICQIKLASARMVGFKGNEKSLMKPQNNIKYAAAYLSYQLHRYHGNTTKAIIAYNMGSTKNLIHTKYSAKVNNRWNKTRTKSRYTCSIIDMEK